MWYAIGAVLIGAAVIGGSMFIMPEAVASVGGMFEDFIGIVNNDPEREEIQDLIDNGFIPVAAGDELDNVRSATVETYGKGTEWEGEYEGGLDKQYIQVKDVDLSEYSEEGWDPIGASVNYTSSFRGTYDGGNYVIKGLEVKGEGKIRQGLFGRTYEATIRNVGLIDNKVTGKWYVGGLVGEAGSTDISNSYATGDVTGSLESGTGGIGGLVGTAGTGTNSNKNTTISNSYATGSVKGRQSVGGLVGSASDNTMISNSYAEGSVTSKGSKINSVMAGGLVGYISTGTTISNSYATGNVTGTVTGAGTGGTGGLVGAFYKFNDPVTISNSYATGLVTAGEGTGKNEVGGLVGQVYKDNDNITISDTYWDINTTGQTSSYGGGAGKTTEEMKNQATYSGWDFDTIWKIDGNDYPTLR